MSLCVFYTELANKEREDQEGVESNVNSDSQSHASPSHNVPDGHTSDQSQSLDGSPPDETNDKSPDHMSANHLTWNGVGPGEEKEDDEVPENAWWSSVGEFTTVSESGKSPWQQAVQRSDN